MQTNNAPAINSAVTAETSLPASPTHQSSTLAATAASTAGPTPPALRPDLLAVADELAAKIREAQVCSLGWLIMTGAPLRQYRDQLPSADWAQILRSGRLPVGARTAQMLVRIARNKVMRNTQRTPQLPHSITILNLLAGLPVPVLEQALDAGTINPKTTLKEADQFVLLWKAHSSSLTTTTE